MLVVTREFCRYSRIFVICMRELPDYLLDYVFCGLPMWMGYYTLDIIPTEIAIHIPDLSSLWCSGLDLLVLNRTESFGLE